MPPIASLTVRGGHCIKKKYCSDLEQYFFSPHYPTAAWRVFRAVILSSLLRHLIAYPRLRVYKKTKIMCISILSIEIIN